MKLKIRVLIVDDEKKFRTTTRNLLERRGFNTILAETGEAAIDKLSKKPDVAVLDIRMPGMDGHQVLREFRDRVPKLPVIMLTGHGDLPSAKDALAEGAFDYLSKPCDINILASKITEAYEYVIKEIPQEEKNVRDVMIPIEEYTSVRGSGTIKDAIIQLKKSFILKVYTNPIMETGHRSIVIFNREGMVSGVLNIRDLLKAIIPAYLSAPKPAMADSIQYSPMFWRGMFTKEVRELIKKRVEEVMSPPPLTIHEESNLMEAAYFMVTNNERRLVVMSKGKVVGMLREQDLFFEIERLLRGLW